MDHFKTNEKHWILNHCSFKIQFGSFGSLMHIRACGKMVRVKYNIYDKLTFPSIKIFVKSTVALNWTTQS